MNVVDSCGWLEYLAAGPNADFFAPALEAPAELVVPTISVYEVFKRVLQQRSEGDALQAVALMQQGSVVDLTPALALEAARTSAAIGLPMADSIMLATARSFAATLWTQDSDFQGIDGVRYVAAQSPATTGSTRQPPQAAAGRPAHVSPDRFCSHTRRGTKAVDIPRIFNITESAHRIHNPMTPEKLATLGAALRLESEARVLDLGSGSGEMLCTWARDHGVIGTGIDMSQLFTEQARLRAEELGVADQVKFIHGDAAGYVSDEKADVAACVGATWIAGGVAGTIELLARSLRGGGIILIGEPYWRQPPPTEEVAKRCGANSISDFLMLPELLASFGQLGYDVVEMVLADQDGWDRYEAAKWLTMRRWLEANPDDELAEDVRAQLTSEPERYAACTREYLGWGVFALMSR